jgi:branched-chain amino acid transport system substrate-binding protein
MIPNGPTPDSFTEGFFQAAAAQKPKPQTVALAAADAEFSLAACDGARTNVKKYGFKIVHDRKYPPSTTDFAPIVRAAQATNPDLFVVCSYPLDSVGMVQAVNEVGFKPKMFGGAMVGLQATVFKGRLKDKLNGIVNYETWVPTKSMMYAGTEEFFKKYQDRAKAAGVDPLGYYLGGWGHAYIDVLGQAITGSKSVDDNKIADYIRKRRSRPSWATSSSARTASGRRGACCRSSIMASSLMLVSIPGAACRTRPWSRPTSSRLANLSTRMRRRSRLAYERPDLSSLSWRGLSRPSTFQ